MFKHKRNFAIILILSMITLRCEAVRRNATYPLTGKFRIIGSTEAVPGQFPGAVSLRLVREIGEHFCGGCIIANTWVLTLTRCVEFISLPEYVKRHGVYPVAVIAGEIHLVSLIEALMAGHLRMITDVFSYPEWEGSHDIALIRVNKAFQFNGKTLKPLILNEHEVLKPGDKLTVASWSLTQNRGDSTVIAMSHNLLYIDLFYIKKDECLQHAFFPYYFEPEYVFCTTDLKAKNHICMGDNGTGLVHGGVLYGLSNIGLCGSNGVSGFNDVKYYFSWIKKVLSGFGDKPYVPPSSGVNSQKLSESIMFLLFNVCISNRLI